VTKLDTLVLEWKLGGSNLSIRGLRYPALHVLQLTFRSTWSNAWNNGYHKYRASLRFESYKNNIYVMFYRRSPFDDMQIQLWKLNSHLHTGIRPLAYGLVIKLAFSDLNALNAEMCREETRMPIATWSTRLHLKQDYWKYSYRQWDLKELLTVYLVTSARNAIVLARSQSRWTALFTRNS
jgi:hypothetical protein